MRSLQSALPALLPRSAAALSTSTARRGLEELIVLPLKEGEKQPTTGASVIGGLNVGRRQQWRLQRSTAALPFPSTLFSCLHDLP
jgi:hypothetical protein